MMKTAYLFFSVFLIATSLQAQDIDKLLKKHNKMTVPYITVQALKMNFDDYTILDTRKKKEYEVSHLPHAIWVGENIDKSRLTSLNKEQPIVVYCTVGIRSENYGEELLKLGFKDVSNLYGSIFSWKDAGYILNDMNGNPTDNVHTFSKAWRKYLKTGVAVY